MIEGFSSALFDLAGSEPVWKMPLANVALPFCAVRKFTSARSPPTTLTLNGNRISLPQSFASICYEKKT